MTLDTSQKVARKEPPMSTEMGTKTTLAAASFWGGLIFAWATLRAAANLCVGNFCVARLIFIWVTFARWGNVYGWAGLICLWGNFAGRANLCVGNVYEGRVNFCEGNFCGAGLVLVGNLWAGSIFL